MATDQTPPAGADASWENRGDLFAAALLLDQAAQQAANNAALEGDQE